MEEKTKEDAVEEKSKEILKGKTGEELEPEKTESPLEEVRRLNRETTEMYTKMNEQMDRFAKQMAEAAIGGSAVAGQAPPPEKKPEQAAFEKGQDIVKKFYGEDGLKA